MEIMYVVNANDPCQIIEVEATLVNDTHCVTNDKTYRYPDYVWFRKETDAKDFLKDVQELSEYSYAEMDNITELGTMLIINFNDSSFKFKYYGIPSEFCEHCDEYLVGDDIKHMDNDKKSPVCQSCLESCTYCSLCQRVISEEEASRYDGYCDDCY